MGLFYNSMHITEPSDQLSALYEIFLGNTTGRLGYHESTSKLIKVRTTPCINEMTLKASITTFNLNEIPVYLP